MEFTVIDIIFGVRLGRLVIVHHLHDLKQIVFSKFLKTICQLLHVDILLLAALLPRVVLPASDTILISSWTRFPQRSQKFRLRVPKRNGMLGFVALILEVQVVIQGMFSALGHGGKHDLHVEFSPSLLLDTEGWFLEDLLGPLERGMQVIGNLFENVRRDIMALVIQQPYLYAPSPHREALYARVLISEDPLRRNKLDLAFDVWHRGSCGRASLAIGIVEAVIS